MSDEGDTLYENLFSSLRSDIKSYSGVDPLVPWIRGIRRMKETLPPQVLKQKLPRFLQKCSETFLTDRRYANDLRYLRVWLQLMDFLDDPRAALMNMEKNGIGMKKSLFYQAYALYYEKKKKFEMAEKIYYWGVQNGAEPADELQKSYDQFLHRMGRHKNKRAQLQGGKTNGRLMNHDMKDANHNVRPENSSNIGLLNDQFSRRVALSDSGDRVDDNRKKSDDDTVVVKFVNTTIVGKSYAEDARHHGLVEPTINTKEAMNVINSMFREPIESSITGRKNKSQSTADSNLENGFSILSDESADVSKPPAGTFEIYIDGEETNEFKEEVIEKILETEKPVYPGKSSTHSIFAKPNDFPLEGTKNPNPRRAHQAGLREDTVVYRFVGSTISEEQEVENVWHHGLVDPTINMKEAMEDINSMFGKPIEFARKSRPKKNENAPVGNNSGGFLILPDDELESNIAEDNDAIKPMSNHTSFLILPDDESDDLVENNLPSSPAKNRSDLFEQTVCTKEAMDEINKLFAMPMDF